MWLVATIYKYTKAKSTKELTGLQHDSLLFKKSLFLLIQRTFN